MQLPEFIFCKKFTINYWIVFYQDAMGNEDSDESDVADELKQDYVDDVAVIDNQKRYIKTNLI